MKGSFPRRIRKQAKESRLQMAEFFFCSAALNLGVLYFPSLSLICGLPPLRILVVNGPLNALGASIFPDILLARSKKEKKKERKLTVVKLGIVVKISSAHYFKEGSKRICPPPRCCKPQKHILHLALFQRRLNRITRWRGLSATRAISTGKCFGHGLENQG